MNEETSIIQTVDFFTPIVDDPYLFGQIAATNSLSDIYAMGGVPLFALNITAFPSEKIPLNVLSQILQGGIDKCNEANISILGGHTIKDDTPKYGLAVTGLIDNNNIIRNNTAKENDDIILTKPIGSGIISTAIKKELAEKNIIKESTGIMNALNDKASNIMKKYHVNACTDVTGFGLLGHLNEMCNGSSLSAKLYYDNVPLISGVKEFASRDIIPGGTRKNLEFLDKKIWFSDSIQDFEKLILADAQTSGGLLISVPAEFSQELIKNLKENNTLSHAVIGQIYNPAEKTIYVK